MSQPGRPGGLTQGNEYERKGQWLEALDAYFAFYSASPDDSPLRKIALDNIRRVIARCSGSTHEALLGEMLAGGHDLLRSVFGASAGAASAPKAKPLVTLVVPCYNVEKYLAACVDSIRSQTLDSFECILVDDFSSDATPAMAKAITQSDKRFRFFQHRANGGLAAARNTGLRLARGRYVAFLDSDDLLARDSLANRAAALARYDDVAMIGGVFDFSQTIDHDFSGEIAGVEAKYRPEYVDFVSAQGDCPFNANQPMLKRSVLSEMGGFPENYPQAEDWRLWSKILRAGYLFLPVRTIGSGYRQTPGSMIRRAPLVHVEKSVRNYYRAHAPYDAETSPLELRYEEIFRGAPLFTREAGYYRAQVGLLSRLASFFGIEIARLQSLGEPVDLDRLFAIVDEAMPDHAAVICGLVPKTIHSWLHNGKNRYHGGLPLSDELNARFARVAHAFIGRLFGSRVPVLLGAHALPERELRRRELLPVDIVFLPHKAYHTKSFQLLLPLLDRAGLTYRFVDSTVPYRQEGAYMPELAEFFLSYNEFVTSRIVPRMVVCMNDWDTVVKPVVVAAKKRGIPTAGIVEGVQDYADADTGRKRNAYREVDHVLLPGTFDRKYFADSPQQTWVTGVQRLDGLGAWTARRAARDAGLAQGGARTSERHVVVNVNFSYGVMTDRRSAWLADIAQACRAAGYRMVVSQHPQDDGDLSAYEVSKKPLYDLLVDADFLISRFSGAILESMVIGCPVIYYNGLAERNDKFHDSLRGYKVADTVEQLVKSLDSGTFGADDGGEFLRQHCDLDRSNPRSSIEKTVDVLVELSKRSQPSLDDMQAFKRDLGS